MTEFWLTYNNNKERLQLPVNPSSIDITNGTLNESITVQGLGETTIIQDPAAKTFEFSSQFPARYLPICSYRSIPIPWDAIQQIEKWKESGNPIRFIATDTPINYPVTIEGFEYSERGGDVGTYYFDINLKEYRFIKPRQVTIKVVEQKPVATVSQTSSRPSNKQVDKVHVVKKGESLWKIAQKELGNGSKYPSIASLNGIKAPYTIYPNQKLMLPS